MRFAFRFFVFATILVGFGSLDARAGFTVNATVIDQGGSSAIKRAAYEDQVRAGVLAAAADWGSHIVSSGVLTLQINFASMGGGVIASAGSLFTTSVKTVGGVDVREQGALSAITGGPSAAPGGFDAVLNINTDWIDNLFFDPDPSARVAAVPYNKVDAQSVFIHELGHAFFMNGWRDWTTGELPGGGNYMSTFDQYVEKIGDDFFFTGDQATALYGGPVPLPYGNLMHVGGKSKSGDDWGLVDVMNPTARWKDRSYISDLDRAIMADTGIALYGMPPAAVPEPSSLALLGIGSLIIGLRRRAA